MPKPKCTLLFVLIFVSLVVIISQFLLVTTVSKTKSDANIENASNSKICQYNSEQRTIQESTIVIRNNTNNLAKTAVILWFGSHAITLEQLFGTSKTHGENTQKVITFFWSHYQSAVKHGYHLIIVHNQNVFPEFFTSQLQNHHIQFVIPPIEIKGVANYNFRFEGVRYALQQLPTSVEYIVHMDFDTHCISNPFESLQGILQQEDQLFISHGKRMPSTLKYYQTQMDNCFQNKFIQEEYLNLTISEKYIQFTPNPIVGHVKAVKQLFEILHEYYEKFDLKNTSHMCDMGLLTWILHKKYPLTFVESSVKTSAVYEIQPKHVLPCYHLHSVQKIVKTCYTELLSKKNVLECIERFINKN